MHPEFLFQLADDRRRDLMDQAARHRALSVRRWRGRRRRAADGTGTTHLRLVDPPPPRVGRDQPGQETRVA